MRLRNLQSFHPLSPLPPCDPPPPQPPHKTCWTCRGSIAVLRVALSYHSPGDNHLQHPALRYGGSPNTRSLRSTFPSQAGKAVINSVNFMPSITPYGRYRIVVTGLLPDGLPDICAEIHFDVGTSTAETQLTLTSSSS